MAQSAATIEVQFQPMLAEGLEGVVAIEQRAYSYPWNRTNFLDALQSGNQAQLLVAGDVLLGYFVAMSGVDEVHLLNITVAPEYQGQGWSRVMLDALTLWARGQAAEWLWLEVRVGNLRAMRVYEAHGYQRVGQRKDYYPAGNGQREDAVVMGLRL
jgi:ribosomal-protein-alanine N-acetyltransferase